MSGQFTPFLNRRLFLSGSLAIAAVPAFAQDGADTVEYRSKVGSVRRNASSFRALDWEPYFDNTRSGAILVDLSSRALHYWSSDRTVYKLYPTSVPLSEDLTRRVSKCAPSGISKASSCSVTAGYDSQFIGDAQLELALSSSRSLER